VLVNVVDGVDSLESRRRQGDRVLLANRIGGGVLFRKALSVAVVFAHTGILRVTVAIATLAY
jgi:hypothetical protein